VSGLFRAAFQLRTNITRSCTSCFNTLSCLSQRQVAAIFFVLTLSTSLRNDNNRVFDERSNWALPCPVDNCHFTTHNTLTKLKFKQTLLLSIGVGASKFLEVRRTFTRIFPNLPEKLLCDFAYKLSPTKIMMTFFGVTYKKKVCVCFSANVVTIFEVKQRWAPFLSRYSGILPRYFRILPKFSEILPGFLTTRLLHHCFCGCCGSVS